MGLLSLEFNPFKPDSALCPSLDIPRIPQGVADGEGRKARAILPPHRKRDIVDVVVVPTETRHRIETAVCASCGGRAEAPNDLPREGSYGKSVVGAISELRAATPACQPPLINQIQIRGSPW